MKKPVPAKKTNDCRSKRDTIPLYKKYKSFDEDYDENIKRWFYYENLLDKD